MGLFDIFKKNKKPSAEPLFKDDSLYTQENNIINNNLDFNTSPRVTNFCKKDVVPTSISEFSDIDYRALYRFKNMPIGDIFDGEVGMHIDFAKFSKKCFELGLIATSTAEDDLLIMKVVDLKKECDKFSIPKAGKKTDLVNRLLECNAVDYGGKHYILTNKAMKILQPFWNKRDENVRSSQEHHDDIMIKYNLDSLKNYANRCEEFTFFAALDDRTCEHCKALHNQNFKISAAKIGVNFPPMHDGCRCTILPVIQDNFK